MTATVTHWGDEYENDVKIRTAGQAVHIGGMTFTVPNLTCAQAAADLVNSLYDQPEQLHRITHMLSNAAFYAVRDREPQ